MQCQVCSKERQQLKVVESKLMSGVTVNTCRTCLEDGKEPRWMVLLVGRTKGFDFVQEYISERKYGGDEILASELTR